MSPARLLQCLVAALLFLQVPALAQPAHPALTAQRVNMRAGPDAAFPLVAWFPARTEVFLVGCTADERWCDVVSGRRRGWIYARYLTMRPRNPVPTVTFSVEEYWNAHYRSQRWFADKPLWVDWGTPSFQLPPKQR